MEAFRSLSSRFCRALALLLAVPVTAHVVQAQNIPTAIVSVTQVLVPMINSNAGHLAANTAGDVFYVSQGDNIAYWLPQGKTTPIALVTGLSGGRSVYVDAGNNVYVPSNYSGNTIEVPYVNGTYATGVASGSTAACSSPTPTAPCNQFGNGGAVTSYYYQPTDLGFDAAGNAYMIDEYNATGPNGFNKNNGIIKWTPGSSGYTAAYLTKTLPQNNNAQIAVDAAGDVYYADGTNLYSIAAGTTTVTTLNNAQTTNPAGVAVDSSGSLYITNASTPYGILEMPALNGVAVPSKQFYFSQAYSANGIAFDGLGDYFSTAYNNATDITETTLYAFNLGSAAIGKASTAAAVTINVLFTGTAAPVTITGVGAGSGFAYVPGSCTAGITYSAGGSCSVNATYTPTAPGLQRGAIVLADAKGNSVVTVSLLGIGLGSQLTSDPGTLTAIGTGLVSPQAIAVDTANNVYIADPGLNSVLLYAPGSSTSTSVGTGLVKPTGVAVDGAGNVFIADAGNDRVVLVPNQNGVLNSAAQSVVLSTYLGPNTANAGGTAIVPGTTKTLGTALALAIDGRSNLYVADTNNSLVVRLANIDGFPSAASASIVPLVGSQGTAIIAPNLLTAPSAVATDSVGNLFVSDSTANRVFEVANYGKSVTSIGTGYSHPSGLATDGAGSLYVADPGNNRLLKIPYENPVYNTNDQYGVGSTILAPFGVALDSASNLYVVDSANAAASMLNRAQGTLPIGRTNINTSSSTLNGYVGNSGNSRFTLGNPDYVATGNTTVFSVMSPASNGCTNSEVILAGFACVLNGSFSPTTTGNFAETLTFSSNANFPTPASLTLTGVGLNLAPTTLALAQTTPTGTAAFGQAIVVTATISSTKAGTPTGTLTVFVDGGSPVSVAVNGFSAAVTLKGLTGGKHLLSASYTGDNNFAPSNTTLTVTVAQTGSSISVTASGAMVFQNPASAQAATPIKFTAVVVPSTSTTPLGTVTLTANGVTLGSGVLANTSGQFIAQITTAALPAGTNIVTATYSGDINYQPSSNTLTVVISPQVYTLTPAANSITMGKVASATTNVQLTSLAGYAGTVGLSCKGLPANSQCGFSPNGVVLQANNLLTIEQDDPVTHLPVVPATYGSVPVIITVNTGITPVVPQPPVQAMVRPQSGRSVPISWAVVGLAPLALLIRRKSRRKLAATRLFLSVLLLASLSLSISGCGSNLIGVTPTGTYNVTVIATSTGSSYTGTLAPGCVAGVAVAPSTAIPVTCTQTAALTLIVQ